MMTLGREHFARERMNDLLREAANERLAHASRRKADDAGPTWRGRLAEAITRRLVHLAGAA